MNAVAVSRTRGGGAARAPGAERRRILLVLPWDLGPIGGVNAVVASLYERFTMHGELQPAILVTNWADKTPVHKTDGGYDKVFLRIRGPIERGGTLRSLAAYLLFLPNELRKAARLVRDLGVSVVNAHYPTLAMLTVALARRLGLHRARLVLSLHGTDIRQAASGRALSRFLWRRLLREADAIVAVSHGLAKEVIALDPRSRSKVAVVHNGLDAEAFTALARLPGGVSSSRTSRHYLLTVGAFEHKKGQDVLLHAFARLAPTHEDVDLVLIGQAGPATQEIESLIHSLGLAPRCFVLKNAPREVVARYMKSASLFVLPSRSEPFGLVLLEAGAFGAPVVATRVGGIPEIIDGPEYGVLVEPDAPEALARALEDLLENAEKAREMGENLRQRVRTVFSWEAAYRKYRDILDGRGGPAETNDGR